MYECIFVYVTTQCAMLICAYDYVLQHQLCVIFSRVGARGVSSGYARTEAEFEQIIDGINEQEVRSCVYCLYTLCSTTQILY